VALITEVSGTIHCKVEFEISGMRAVTVDTSVLYRGMDEFFPFEGISLVCVTLETYFVSGAVEHLGVIGLMRVMAHDTAADRNRSMDIFPCRELPVVAHQTKIGPLCAELVLIGRLMRVMALGTVSVLYRLVNSLHGIDLVVAFITFVRYPGDRFEFVFSLVIVTDRAVSDRYGSMDEFVLPHVGMALARDA
jgi:hypothetical protein